MSRKLRNIEERNKFYIFTNGEKTEVNYFTLLKSKRSIFDVKIKFLNDDPYQLVKHAIEQSINANQIWCVFDIDNSYEENSLVPALNLARENNINIAFSNLAFEVWLISHYEKCETSMDTQRLNRKLDFIVNELFPGHSYGKTNKLQLERFFIPKVKTAIEYSKVVYQKWIKKHNEEFDNHPNYRFWEWNSCSSVFLLVEALELKDLNNSNENADNT